ncbi:hypothetical protein COLO4_28898 [Corchorus olitorius]|uniref:Uncharacterized protein n=1 Tax=Corchorus olitorius TaxID=93759 RepID=A0A1R3HHT2_9ROSI|nr:hypothetical protein COLO4_28898 [Corchorus olitorius]
MTTAAPITAKHCRHSPKAPSKCFIHLPSPEPTPTINRIQRTPTPVRSPSTLKLRCFHWDKDQGKYAESMWAVSWRIK